MYKNHYISLVHVKGIGASAKSNLLQASKKIPHMSFGGDTNLSIAASKFEDHQYESELNDNLIVKMNTEPFAVLDDILSDQEFDLPGKTASGNVAHDGIVIKSEFSSVYKILGSRWAIHTDNSGRKIISSDHKGILLSVNPSMVQEQFMSTPVKDNI
jgi:hypothetical protein